MLNNLNIKKQLLEHDLLSQQEKMEIYKKHPSISTDTESLILGTDIVKKELELNSLELNIDILKLLK